MTAKEWLMRGWNINREINQLHEEREKAFSLACKTTGQTDKEKVQESIKNSTEDRNIRYSDYSKVIDERTDELYKIKEEILQAINKVENGTYRTLLIARYIGFKKFEEIATEMNYSYIHVVKNLHPKALSSIRVY